MIHHVVLLKLKEGSTDEQVAAVEQGLRGLVGQIDGLTDLRWGPNASPEDRGGGFGRGFLMTFANAAARDAYIPHPAHARVVERVRAVADDVLVYDIEDPS